MQRLRIWVSNIRKRVVSEPGFHGLRKWVALIDGDEDLRVLKTGKFQNLGFMDQRKWGSFDR